MSMLLESLVHLFTPRARDKEKNYGEKYPKTKKYTKKYSKVPSCNELEFGPKVKITVA